MQSNSKIAKVISIGIFILILFAPILQDLFSIFPQKSVDNENRALSKKPKFNIKKLDAYPDSATSYYEDHFAFRGQLLVFNDVFSLSQKRSQNKDVIIGKNGFLYLDRLECPLYEGNDNFTLDRIKSLAELFEKRNEIYSAKGIKYYLIIIPTKCEIYPEYLPNFIQRTDETSTDKLCNLMQNNSNVNFVYLKDYLISKKGENRLYFINDNHWNELGAYFASDTILRIIKKDFPKIPIYDKSCYQFDTTLSTKGNLADMILSKQTIKLVKDIIYKSKLKDESKRAVNGEKRGYTPSKNFAYTYNFEIVKTTNNKLLPKIVIIRDSYATAIIPFLSNSFNESIYIWDAWKFEDNLEIINNEKPDIVLNIILESHLKGI